MIEVQTIKTDWKNLPAGLIWYIVGQPKSGKTTALSKWSPLGQEGVLIIDTDLGGDFVDGANIVPCIGLNAPLKPLMMKGEQVVLDGDLVWERDDDGNHVIIPPEERGYNYRIGPNKGKPMPVYSLNEIASWLAKEWDDLPYDTVVLDTIDKINVWNEERTCARLGINAMGDGSFGNDWAGAKKGVMKTFTFFQTMVKQKGGTLIIVSHSKETTIIPAKGNKKAVTQLGPALPNGLVTQLTGQADVIGYTTGENKEGKYLISFEAYSERKVGSRLRPIAQKELEFNYETIISVINNYSEGDK